MGTVEEDVCGQLGVTMRYKMPRYGNGGLAMGVFRHAKQVCIWNWHRHDGVEGGWDPPPPHVWTRQLPTGASLCKECVLREIQTWSDLHLENFFERHVCTLINLLG